MQGKYKKMNSGKYLYKVAPEKKVQAPKKITVRNKKLFKLNNI